MQAVFKECLRYSDETNGYFSPYFVEKFDPTGYVKGWAIERAAQLLERLDIGTYCLNIAGDILLKSNSAHTWRIGLQHPVNKQAITGTIVAKNLAIATSGTYVRGDHIF
jgi:thiamine biosynthesis lipoprotein